VERAGESAAPRKEATTMTCTHCGAPMKLINNVRSLLLLYWCPTCQRFAEQHRNRRRQS
jgi:hypothetical protein